MPDEIAGRATLLLFGGLFAGAGLGALISWLLRRKGGQGGSTALGIASGLAVFGGAMAWVVSDMAAVVWERSGQIRVQGTLLSFEAVTLRRTPGGARLRSQDPVVEFTLPDGQTHLVRGLAGSLQRREPGSAVPVLVDPQRPESALIADFQNQYAALWLFGSFGALAWLGALYALGCALVGPSAVDAAARPTSFEAWRRSPAGAHWRQIFGRMGLATAAAALLGVFVLAEFIHVGRAIGIGLSGLAAALACGAVASVLRPAAHVGLTLLGHSLGVLAAGLFGAFVWALTAY